MCWSCSCFSYCFITYECSLKQYNRFCSVLNFRHLNSTYVLSRGLFLLLNIVFFRFGSISPSAVCVPSCIIFHFRQCIYSLYFWACERFWIPLQTMLLWNFLAYVSHDCARVLFVPTWENCWVKGSPCAWLCKVPPNQFPKWSFSPPPVGNSCCST